jgi:hypothetical protein
MPQILRGKPQIKVEALALAGIEETKAALRLGPNLHFRLHSLGLVFVCDGREFQGKLRIASAGSQTATPYGPVAQPDRIR